jgi:hypothetical protein
MIPTIRRLLLPIALVPMLASSMCAQGNPWAGPRHSAGDVALKIESKRTTYRVGDAIGVRLKLRNGSGIPADYVAGAARQLADLRVLDDKGQEVRRTLLPEVFVGGNYISIAPEKHIRGYTRLNPQAEVLLRTKSGQDWIDLRAWGYDLQDPGIYTIVGLPTIRGPKLTPDSTLRSNKVVITITR